MGETEKNENRKKTKKREGKGQKLGEESEEQNAADWSSTCCFTEGDCRRSSARRRRPRYNFLPFFPRSELTLPLSFPHPRLWAPVDHFRTIVRHRL